jgi:beta-mannosidase
VTGRSADLSGAWLAHPAGGDLHQRFSEPGFDDDGWLKVGVPGHWRLVPELAESDGPVLYRHGFSGSSLDVGRRRFLEFDGVFYDGDVWLDGAYLGATEGYFAPHAFEITAATAAGGDHMLAVEVACPPQHDRTAKRLITGVFSHWDCLDARWNPGGIWRPVRLVETGPARISTMRVVCTEATEQTGRLRIDLVIDALAGSTAVAVADADASPGTARIRARLTGPGVAVEAVRDEVLAAGSNRLRWTLSVDDPPRWWPRRLGDQPRCDLEVVVEVDGQPSDARRVRTAFREVRLEDWVFHVNGERLFVMGSNYGPTRMALAEADDDDARRDVDLAAAANLDMLRVHAHVARPELYEAADDAGLLLWQDFPLQWGYARGIRRQAVRQATEMVDLLGHHPSIALWCAHNEPFAADADPGAPWTPKVVAKAAVTMVAPTWNKNLLDRSIRRAIQRADGTRPVNPHSGVFPGPSSPGTDTHFYFGWYHGHMAELAAMLRAWPRVARFVSEFGAQAVPAHAEFMEPDRWPDLDWDRLAERHACQKVFFDRHVPPADFPDFDAWRDATQAYQAALIQLQVEDLRRVKYRPTGGFLHFFFADALPAVTWSVLDHVREPKTGYGALRDACRAVLPMLDPRTGDLHVVSELRGGLEGAVVECDVGGERRHWTGDVPADAVTSVGRVDDIGAAGKAVVTLTHPEIGTIRNEYRPLLLRLVRERYGSPG